MQQALKERFKYWQFIIYMPIYLFFFVLAEKMTADITYINIPLDDKIPFVEGFIVPYLLWFPFMALGIAYVFFMDKKEFLPMGWNLVIGMSLFLVVSFIFPNGLQLRPEVFPHDNVCTDLVKHLYSVDTSTNVIPSIHVFNSLVCGISFGRVLWWKKHKICAVASYTMAGLIVISTMFVKQHSIVDVVSGILMYVVLTLVLGKLYKKADEARAEG